MNKNTYLTLEKENFKFSSAHFLIFNEHSAEMLHGHNYRVKVKIYPQSGTDFFQLGYFIDFAVIKKIVKELCDQWDEHILLPERHPDMKYQKSSDEKNYEIHFRDRFYSLPIRETIWLPVTNTSVENFSVLLAEKLAEKLKVLEVKKLKVTVEESAGQSSTTLISI